MLRLILKDLHKVRELVSNVPSKTGEAVSLVSDLIDEIERELQEGYYPDEETDQDE